jgi:hypothetical protein
LIIICRLIVPLAVAVVTAHAGVAFAQDAIPAPPSASADVCMKGYVPLREEAEQRGKVIKAASERHAPPEEACRLIANFGQAEIKMIRYVESRTAACGISPQVAVQLKTGHMHTVNMQKKVCEMAQGQQPYGPTGDFWTLPEKQI